MSNFHYQSLQFTVGIAVDSSSTILFASLSYKSSVWISNPRISWECGYTGLWGQGFEETVFVHKLTELLLAIMSLLFYSYPLVL